MEKLSHFYTKLAIVYQFKQNKNPEEARRLANVVVRDVLGVMGFFGVLTVFTILDNFVIPVTEGNIPLTI